MRLCGQGCTISHLNSQKLTYILITYCFHLLIDNSCLRHHLKIRKRIRLLAESVFSSVRFGRTLSCAVLLWHYHNNRTIWHQPVNFLHFLVCNGNTPFRPVKLCMRCTNPPETIFDAMDHDISARRNTQFFCPLFVYLVWIGNMKRQVIFAVAVS